MDLEGCSRCDQVLGGRTLMVGRYCAGHVNGYSDCGWFAGSVAGFCRLPEERTWITPRITTGIQWAARIQKRDERPLREDDILIGKTSRYSFNKTNKA